MFRDASAAIKISDADIDSDGKITAKFSTNFNGTDAPAYNGKIPFTVMVYDPNYVAIEEFDKNNRAVMQGASYDFDLHDFVQPATFSLCDEESDCTNSARTVGNLLYSWGFNLEDSLEVHKVKGLSYLSKWSSDAGDGTSYATITTNGTAYNSDSGTNKLPGEMGSYLVVCANSAVCQIVFAYETANESTIDFTP